MIKKKTPKGAVVNQTIVTVVLGVVVLIFGVVIFALFQSNQTLRSDNRNLAISRQKVTQQDKAIKDEKVKRYSAKNLTFTSTATKTNIDHFFQSIFQWTYDTYVHRSDVAKKYADSDVVDNMLGEIDPNSQAVKDYVKSAKKMNSHSEVLKSHQFIENSDGRTVEGLYMANIRLYADESNSSDSLKLYRFMYDVNKGKIAKLEPVSVQ